MLTKCARVLTRLIPAPSLANCAQRQNCAFFHHKRETPLLCNEVPSVHLIIRKVGEWIKQNFEHLVKTCFFLSVSLFKSFPYSCYESAICISIWSTKFFYVLASEGTYLKWIVCPIPNTIDSYAFVQQIGKAIFDYGRIYSFSDLKRGMAKHKKPDTQKKKQAKAVDKLVDELM